MFVDYYSIIPDGALQQLNLPPTCSGTSNLCTCKCIVGRCFWDCTRINPQHRTAGFSGIFDDIIKGVQAGLQVFQTVSASGAAGGAGGGNNCAGQAKGTAQITACASAIIAALNALIAQVGQQPYQTLINQANTLVAALSNPAYFYQAKSGSDAAALNNAKTQAQQKLQELIAAANTAANNPIGTAIGQTGQVISSGGNTVTTGLDSISSALGWVETHPVTGGAIIAGIAYLLFYRKK
jgi:hypothetical protein